MHKQTKKENLMEIQLRIIKEFTWDLKVPYPAVRKELQKYDFKGEHGWQIKDAIEEHLRDNGWGIVNDQVDMHNLDDGLKTAIVDCIDEIINVDVFQLHAEYEWLCDLKTAVHKWEIGCYVDFYNDESEVVS
jgi:hypothetical protein